MANILPGLGIDEFLTRTDVVAGTTSNFLTDALRSPIAVTDASGTVQTEYTYEPFGKTTVPGASNTNPYQYTGRENDGTGLYYYRARYYSPQLQRFISEDPILSAGNPLVPFLLPYVLRDSSLHHPYGYVGNSPLNWIDPAGLSWTQRIWGGALTLYIKQYTSYYTYLGSVTSGFRLEEGSDVGGIFLQIT